MAALHTQGRLGVGDPYRYRSIIGTEFVGRIVETTTVGDHPAIVPEITGSAHIIGKGELPLTEGDPFPAGFTLALEESRSRHSHPRRGRATITPIEAERKDAQSG